VTIVFDIQQMRPGCALIQAIMGGSPGVLNNFPAECWLDAPTPGMALYNVTDEQLNILIERTLNKH
jgi:hypothetical protein